jgi:hypothetical protein
MKNAKYHFDVKQTKDFMRSKITSEKENVIHNFGLNVDRSTI